MITALRTLRYSYTSAALAQEQLLWKDRWESLLRQRRADGTVEERAIEREGLGLQKTHESLGFGWWLPGKFNHHATRFHDQVGSRLAAGNALLREDYSRQWRTLREIRDIHARMLQASGLARSYEVARSRDARRSWLEYLHAIILEQFDRDVWKEAHKTFGWNSGADMTDETRLKYPEHKPPIYCYEAMRTLFHDRAADVSHTRPHLISGNKIRTASVRAVLEDLFCPGKNRCLQATCGATLDRRKGWEATPYRIGVRLSMEAIRRELGPEQARRWFRDLLRIVAATHWILPWPTSDALIATTKESQAKGQKRRLIWASIAYREAEYGRAPKQLETRTGVGPEDVFEQDTLSQLLLSGYRFNDATSLANHFKENVDLKNMQVGRAVDTRAHGGTVKAIIELNRPLRLSSVMQVHNRTWEELEEVFKGMVESRKTRQDWSMGCIDDQPDDQPNDQPDDFEPMQGASYDREETAVVYDQEITATPSTQASDGSWVPAKRARALTVNKALSNQIRRKRPNNL
jgi:hypothetical protein